MLMIYVTHDQVEALTFADEVVVMKDGAVLQIGTPADLFERPAHSFVGYFIGSPGMNFLPAVVSGRRATVDTVAFELERVYDIPATGKRVELGFRPDYATVLPAGGLPVRVLKVEDLGRRRLARVALGALEVIATLPPDVDLAAGEPGGLHVPPEHLHIFVDELRVEGLRA
jgi:glycerol transport system ATP-binding protein